jgi:hypothetical protein
LWKQRFFKMPNPMRIFAPFSFLTTLLCAAMALAQDNVAPVISLSADPLAYALNTGAVVVDPTATVSDPDSPNMLDGELTVALNTTDPDVTIAIRNNTGGITVSGTNVKWNNVTFGVYAFDTESSTLFVNFNSSSTISAIQGLLRAVAYANATTNEPQTETLSFVLSDGDGGTSAPALKTIHIGTTTNVTPGFDKVLRLKVSPNPFSLTGTIRFEIPRSGPVRLSIFDLAGQRQRLLVDQTLTAGPNAILWDGRDDTGRELPSGVYFARLESAGQHSLAKLVLVR